MLKITEENIQKMGLQYHMQIFIPSRNNVPIHQWIVELIDDDLAWAYRAIPIDVNLVQGVVTVAITTQPTRTPNGKFVSD